MISSGPTLSTGWRENLSRTSRQPNQRETNSQTQRGKRLIVQSRRATSSNPAPSYDRNRTAVLELKGFQGVARATSGLRYPPQFKAPQQPEPSCVVGRQTNQPRRT